MQRIVILGHGSVDLNPASSDYPREVLVPPDTTLQFYSDAGQVLQLPGRKGSSGKLVDDYDKVAEFWKQLRIEGDPLRAKAITYNFALTPDYTDEHRECALNADWGGAILEFTDSATKYLCTDTTGQCPTPALLHPDGAAERDLADPFEMRFEHKCDGILGRHAGNELHWIACTSFMTVPPELPVLDSTGVVGPGAPSKVSLFDPYDPDVAWMWVDELEKIKKHNREKFPKEGGGVAIVAGGNMVLIGDGHDQDATDYVSRQEGDIEGGMLTVKRGAFGLQVQVQGVSKKQDVFESEIQEIVAQIHKIVGQKVTFVP